MCTVCDVCVDTCVQYVMFVLVMCTLRDVCVGTCEQYVMFVLINVYST